MNTAILIMGLGSMGKRRIRNLQALGVTDIVGLDVREDRRTEAAARYGISTVANLEALQTDRFVAFVISTPPDRHNECIRIALARGKSAFVEASVILEGLGALRDEAVTRGVRIVPSCTMRFHPAIRDMQRIVASGAYGRVTNFSYHFGQYLPDWHPWERVTDYYVGKRETGGARELLPFELTWLVDLIGYPTAVKAFRGKTMDVGADIDDTYVIAVEAGSVRGTVVIDVVARYATRHLILNMERGQIVWRWDEPAVKLYEGDRARWIQYGMPQGKAAEGYNKNIVEEMYVDEMRAFLDTLAGRAAFPNTLDDDMRVLALLQRIEAS